MKKNIQKEILAIILITFILSIIRYTFIYDSYPLIKQPKINKDNLSINEINLKAVQEILSSLIEPKIIDLNMTKFIYENDLAIFIDARNNDAYNESHIAHAINVPYDFLIENYDLGYLQEIINSNEIEDCTYFIIGSKSDESFIKNIADEEVADDEKNVYVLYCSGEGCSLSEDLGFYLFDELKFNNILIYEGGMPEWIDNSLPTVKKK